MKCNLTPQQWAAVVPYAVLSGSDVQALNVFEMATQDIARMAIEIKRLEMLVAKKSDGGVEAKRHAAPMASVPAGVTSGSDGVAAIPSEHVIQYVQQFGGRCRDCADHNGVCPYRGMPCGDDRKAIRHVLTALYYGTRHGFIYDPDHLPHREALAEFLSSWVCRRDAQDCADATLRIIREAHPTLLKSTALTPHDERAP